MTDCHHNPKIESLFILKQLTCNCIFQQTTSRTMTIKHHHVFSLPGYYSIFQLLSRNSENVLNIDEYSTCLSAHFTRSMDRVITQSTCKMNYTYLDHVLI